MIDGDPPDVMRPVAPKIEPEPDFSYKPLTIEVPVSVPESDRELIAGKPGHRIIILDKLKETI